MITIVSLGVEEGDLTQKGKSAILSAEKVLVRTALTASYQNVKELGKEHQTLDFVYETAKNFRSLHKKLARVVLEEEKRFQDVVYCVDGSATEDNSVKEILKKRKTAQVISGVSKSENLAKIAKFSGCSFTALSAYEAFEMRKNYGLCAPLIIYDLDDCDLAGDIKLLLADCFGDETECLFIRGGKKKKIKIYELDRQKQYDYSTAVCLEKQEFLQKTRFSLADLEEIIRRLRLPNGCPWDRAQTPDSVKMCAVEESYELLDAILSGEANKILEETGDVLMQAVFQAALQQERGAFNLTDAVSGVCEKLITRHTHVFGEDSASSASEALSVWDKNKMTEKSQHTFADAVNDVPTCFPALLQAQKICKRLSKGGWAFASFDGVKEKLKEEFEELEKAVSSQDKAKIKEEVGDFLMCCAWLCRAVDTEGEEALLETLSKIKKRYTAFEQAVILDGKDVGALTREEWLAYYRRAKEQA